MNCQKGEKATVTYKFSNSVKRNYITENTPITVTTRQSDLENFEGGQCPITYLVKYRSIDNSGTTGEIRYASVKGPITAITTGHLPSGVAHPFESEWQIRLACSGGANYVNGVEIIRVIYTLYGYGELLSIEPEPPYLDNCGEPEKQCEILVYNSSNSIIFSDRGKCPVTYSITCGDCPEGTIKCDAPGYPGYCCLPCKEIAEEVKAIANQVRRFNNV